MENDKPPVDPGFQPGPEGNPGDFEAPPEATQGSGELRPPTMSRYSYGWALFAFVILSLLGLQLFSYFSEKPDKKLAVSQEIKLTLKSSLAMEKLLSGTTVKSDKPQTSFVAVKEALTKHGVKDTETARYLVVVDRFLDKPMDPKALEVLGASKEPIDKAYLQVADKDPAAVKTLQARSDELVDKAALALAKEDGGDKSARAEIMPMSEAIGVVLAPVGLIALVGLGLVTIVGWIVYSKTGGVGPPVGWPRVAQSLESADLGATKAATFLLLYFIVGQTLVAGVMHSMKVDFAVIALAGQVMGVVFLVGLGTWKASSSDIGLKEMIRGTMSWPKMLTAGFMGYVANFPIFISVTLLTQAILSGLPTPNHVIAEEIQTNNNPWITVVIFLVAAVMAPYLEETTFRGWLFGGLMTRTRNVALSIFVAGATFALIHPQGPIAYPALACIGAMGAYLTYRTGSLVPAMTMHCLHNATLLLLGKSML